MRHTQHDLRSIALDVARHEAGHHVAGRILGLSMQGISIEILDLRGAHHGTSEIRPVETLSTTSEVVDFLGKRVQQLYAGVVARATRGSVGNRYEYSQITANTLRFR